MNSKRFKLKRFKKNKAIPNGIRQGQELDAVLGYEVERGLHENNETKKKRRKKRRN